MSCADWVEDYLRHMDLTVEAPSVEYLSKICTRHLATFPFENISKLLYYRDLDKTGFLAPPPQLFVENYEGYQFGGTCFTLNGNLNRLLTALGFNCHFVMLSGEHMANVVRFGESVCYYVDCGAAAPFFTPVRLGTLPQIVQFGTDKIIIEPVDVDKHEYQYRRFTGDEQNGKTWTFLASKRCTWEDFKSILEAAHQPGTTFMSILRCQLWQPGRKRSVSLVDHTFTIRYQNGQTQRYELTSMDDIKRVLADEFGLPKLPVEEAVHVLEQLGVDIFRVH
ncbi:MAG: arylamine N-acetyltransferase [Alicyclobacillus macrosporangiidus]|uniref:arylamine N-acetyltransferase n=1 Tax=Alicyclobacillus macrosporangiidus TaxID=392015 RepID=UPI0026F12857|nr:arylamine N-acetyltransferase [Alicyclobacillus macrosporangiidus]MCL6597507.1 arylamine N-acetyltransferase [Alicyclobacillus macrosporangiidus]